MVKSVKGVANFKKERKKVMGPFQVKCRRILRGGGEDIHKQHLMKKYVKAKRKGK